MNNDRRQDFKILMKQKSNYYKIQHKTEYYKDSIE